MSVVSKRLVLAAALLVMPLQGVAATLSVLLCHGDIRVQTMHADTGGDHAVRGESQPNGGGTGGNFAYHPCCHNIVSATPRAIPVAAPLETGVQAIAPDALHDLFFPDRPDRPPLS